MERSASNLAERLASYLLKVTGVSIRYGALDKPRALPLHIEAQYAFQSANLYGTQLLICLFIGDEMPSAAVVAQHGAILKEKLAAEPVFVFASMTPWLRRDLIDRKLSFAVPGAHLYLPLLLIDLRERFDAERKERPFISWLAQVILLRHLNHIEVEGLSVRGLAERLATAASSTSRAVKELCDAELASVSDGKTKRISFTLPPTELWSRALPLLRTPVRSLLSWPHSMTVPELPDAGEQALARYTMISAPPIAVKACYHFALNRLSSGALLPFETTRTPSGAIIQSWYYDPRQFGSKEAVDPYSLYLTLKDDADPRIQKALAQLVDERMLDRIESSFHQMQGEVPNADRS